MTTPVMIRPVLPDEWARWRDIRVRMLRDDPVAFATRWEDAAAELDETWRDWVGAATGERRILFAAETDGRWIGVVAAFVRIDPREAQLMSMWVDPVARGQGVAEALIGAVGEWASARGCETVYLFVQEANSRARRLYERAGFRPTGARTPTGRGRAGFKVVLAAPVDELTRSR
jgi:ribosomal protein S18 acetylase RimI-like enzyme